MKYDDDLDFEEIKLSDNRKKTDWRVFLVIVIVAAAVLALIIFLIVNAGGRDRPPENEKMPVAETQAGDAWPEQDESESIAEENDTETESEVTAVENVAETERSADVQAASEDEAMTFMEVSETVTAKEQTNLRESPSQTEDSEVLAVLMNQETAERTGINEETGWSRLNYNGTVCYAVSSYLTTDLDYRPKEAESGDGIKTQFTEVNDIVTAKIEVNLRALPSVTNPDATVIAVLHNGETVTRTGINEDYGWSRVDYNGQTLYCISSYLTTP